MNRGFFETELLLNLEITYEYKEMFGEITLEDTRIELGNGKNIDLHDFLPVKDLNKIDEQIIEDIEWNKRH